MIEGIDEAIIGAYVGEDEDLHDQAGRRRARRAATPRSPSRSSRSRSASCPSRTTSSPSWPASSTRSTSCSADLRERLDPRQEDAAGRPGPRQGPRGPPRGHRGPAAGDRRRLARSRCASTTRSTPSTTTRPASRSSSTTQGKTREEFDTDIRDEAEKAVKTQLVLDSIADAEKVTVDDNELTERIIYQAQRFGISPDEYVQRAQQSGQLGAIFADVRRGKALASVVRLGHGDRRVRRRGRPRGAVRRPRR